MTDNARIVREALHRMAAAMEVYGPAPVAVKTPLEDRPIYGLYPFKALTALETELATAKADLERAREALKEWAAEPCEMPGPEDMEGGCCRSCRTRAALAPEQKGGKP